MTSNRGIEIFVYIFCLTSKSISVSDQVTDIIVVNIERIGHK